MPTCILCGCEIDGTSGTVEFGFGYPVAKCHACADEFRAEVKRFLRQLSVERGMKRGDPVAALATLPAFGPVS